MSARNPGPKIQRMPLGFSSFSPRVLRDQQRRRAFFDSEVNTRIYKAIYESLGVKGRIPFNRKISESKINLRCIHGGATNGVNRYTNMSRFAMQQAQQEGWLFKYGYVPDRFH
jgi:ribosomal protein S14